MTTSEPVTPALTTSVLVVDDEAVIRDGLSLIIEMEPTLELAGVATDGQDAVRRWRDLRPDVVLMDLQMPGWDGIRATAHIVSEDPSGRVIALTTFDAEQRVWEALRAGACGYLLKDTPRAELVAGIQAGAAGHLPLSPRLQRRVAERFTEAPVPPGEGVPERLRALSDRELDVLRLVAAGATNEEIARSLLIGSATVKTHLANVLTKLGARDRVQAVITAYESGLVRPGTPQTSKP